MPGRHLHQRAGLEQFRETLDNQMLDPHHAVVTPSYERFGIIETPGHELLGRMHCAGTERGARDECRPHQRERGPRDFDLNLGQPGEESSAIARLGGR